MRWQCCLHVGQSGVRSLSSVEWDGVWFIWAVAWFIIEPIFGPQTAALGGSRATGGLCAA